MFLHNVLGILILWLTCEVVLKVVTRIGSRMSRPAFWAATGLYALQILYWTFA